MKRLVKLGAAMAFAAGCSGSTGASGDQATIDDAVAEEMIEIVSSFVPVCHTGNAALRASTPDAESPALRLVRRLRGKGYLRVDGVRANILEPTKPDDEFGDCGGKFTYPSYSHSNGTTTATASFQNYCTVNENTGNRETLNGTVSMVDHGTPSSGGPITTSFDLTAPAGLTITEQGPSGGTTLSSSRVKITDFQYVIGVPDGTPTASHPDQMTMDDAQVTDLTENKTLHQSSFTGSFYNTPSGGDVQSFAGRTHLSNGKYMDLSTNSPITRDANLNVVGGQLTFAGSGGTSIVVYYVPGPIFQATMNVNGTPVTNVPACQ